MATELTPDQLSGKTPVKVFNLTPNGVEVFEGNAIIIKVHQGDRGGVYATVQFPDGLYDRWVFANKQ